MDNEPSILPHVSPEDPTSEDVPFVGLLNPRSGSRAGARFLAEAAKLPTYRSRLFDIVAVATQPDVMSEFRRQLERVKEEVLRKMERQPGKEYRPRLICGGGDGTASFAIWCIFRALRAEGGGSEWSDDELRRFFPAFVQMPLGTGNDLAGALGWGRDINPANRPEVQSWFRSAIGHSSPVRAFDVWGIVPRKGQAGKVCALSGLEDGRFQKFGEAGPSVPFLCLLYFSMGFDAFVAAQVELHRTDSRIENFLEYARAIPASLFGDQRRNVDLTGVSISVPEGGGARRYFPPPGRESSGYEYCSVGAMNINSMSGGIWSAKDAALPDDGRLDLYRQRNYLKNVLRRGNRYKTEKHERAVIAVPGHLPGVHFQFDGEARFLFHPEGKDFEMEVMRVMQIPVVLGPGVPASCRRKTGPSWVELQGQDADLPDAAFIPAVCLQECRDLCARHGLGGFCVRDGRAHFRAGAPSELLGRLVPCEGATFHLRDGADAAAFRFVGIGREDVADFRERLEAWASGQLVAEVNASASEIAELQVRSDAHARGVCRRSRRVHHDFGVDLCLNQCTSCGGACSNHGCRGCCRRFCGRCFPGHLGTAPNVEWMYGDAGLISVLARSNRLRWSSRLCLDDAISEMDAMAVARPIRVKLFASGTGDDERVLESAKGATAWLAELRDRDEADNKDRAPEAAAAVRAALEPPAAETDSDVDSADDAS